MKETKYVMGSNSRGLLIKNLHFASLQGTTPTLAFGSGPSRVSIGQPSAKLSLHGVGRHFAYYETTELLYSHDCFTCPPKFRERRLLCEILTCYIF